METNSQRAKYLIKNTAIFTFGSVATKFISFFLVPLYTNALTTAEYGTVDLVSTICSVLAPVLMLNISESVMRFSLDKDADYSKILSIGSFVYLISLIFGLLVFPINSLFEVTSSYSSYIFFYTISLAGSQLYLCYLRGREKLLEYVIGNMLQTLSVACLNIFFLLRLKLGIPGYFTAYIIAGFITMIYAFFTGKVWTVLKKPVIDHALAKEMIKYSVVLIPNTFMWWIMNSSDRIMVTAMVGVAANGIYGISYKLPTLVSTFTNIFNRAWGYSAIKEEGAIDEQEYNNRVLKVLISFSMLVGIGLLAISKPFLRIYVGSSFFEAWRYIPFLVIGSVYMTFGTFFATSYTVHKDSFGYLFSGLFGAVFNISLNFILIPVLQVYGAAIATCVSYIAVFTFRYFHTRKYIHYHILNRYFMLGSLLLIADAGMMYIDSLYAQIIQIILLLVSFMLYVPVWKPLLNVIVQKIFHHKA